MDTGTIRAGEADRRALIRPRLSAALYLPVGIVAAIALMLGLQIRRQLDDARWAVHSDEVIAKTSDLAKTIVAQQAALRGYLLVADPAFLEQYRLADPTAGFAELRALVADNPSQQMRLDTARNRYETWRTEYAAPQLASPEQARSTGSQRDSQRAMDDLRSSLDGFTRVEMDFRRARVAAADASFDTTRTAFVGLFLSAAAALAFVSRRQLAATSEMYESAIGRERDAREATEREQWLREGQARLAEGLLGEQTIESLGENALASLCTRAGADVGAFYVAEANTWRRVATLGIDPEKGAPDRLKLDEGFVGRAAAQREIVHVDGLPAGYLRVRTGVGESDSRALVAIPAIADGIVFGVVELGFLRPVEPRSLELLGRTVEAIGAAVRSESYRRRLRELLEESQQQTEELQAQQEELRVANDELEQQGAALRTAQKRLEERQKESDAVNARLEENTFELAQSREAYRIKALEAERTSRYKSEFLANVSHELRTPLNSTLILAKLLADNKHGNLTEEQVRFATTIHKSGNDLLALINDILDLSQAEGGHVTIRPTDVVVARMLEALERTFDPIAKQGGVAFRIERDASGPDLIVTDALRLEQILKNLLSNAFKFTHQGAVTLRVAGGDGEVSFSVVDTGIGIPADQLDAIFEPFRQADGTTNRKYGGTGLGLSISRELALLLGGRLTVESEPSKGSAFRLQLPLDGSALASKPANPPPPPAPPMRLEAPASAAFADDREALDGETGTILVVEDDVAFARILFDLSHERGLKCIVAHDARSAVALARQHVPSAIVLDVNLPDHTGLYVLDQLKHDPKTRHVPVHVVSVSDQSEQALAMGAIGYLQKPADREALARALGALETRAARGMRRLLIVEDDTIHRDSLAHALAADDLDIVSVATVKGALEALAAQTFDCVVTDLGLPDESGFALLERMAADASYPFPPVIVYTGRQLTAEEEQRLRGFSTSVIVKGAHSLDRLLDEVSLFLHVVESRLPNAQQRLLQHARDRDGVLDGKTLLVVEDDVRNVFALTKVLEPLGAHVVIARNGIEALRALDAEPSIALILMDIMMPEMDGLEATRAIRRLDAWKKTPIIALTAKAMPDDREDCIQAGANDYIAKPIDVDMLVSLLRVWMPR